MWNSITIGSFSKCVEIKKIILNNVVGKIIKMSVRVTTRDTNYRFRVKIAQLGFVNSQKDKSKPLVQPVFSFPCTHAEIQDYW